ncbi:hypothetical protein [Saccharopolyspora spinosa]|uniref:Uncharacterized protein n=1 Tax=Saccharopolyspora spinosa TaxID=60894 RepID=A0A2N3XSB9_SACSN|nr:hypothetical protein [Saccharopolyspora spinosa]PKW13578.1 hypothetical protein A8926_1116 [Saccharopolyspora spinosa]
MDVFVWGSADTEHAVRVLEALRRFEVLDASLGSADVFGVRDGVLVELRQIDPSGLLVRFVDGTRPGRASIVAHSFLWILTRRGAVDEAMLVGPGVEPLRFRDGRIQRLTPLSSEHCTDD